MRVCGAFSKTMCCFSSLRSADQGGIAIELCLVVPNLGGNWDRDRDRGGGGKGGRDRDRGGDARGGCNSRCEGCNSEGTGVQDS